MLKWHRLGNGHWNAGPYDCVKLHDKWRAIGPNGVIGNFDKLNGLAGAKNACLVQERKRR